MIQRKACRGTIRANRRMKHAIIIAHPALRSFTASVAAAYRGEVEALGHATVTRDLYRLDFDPCLKAEEIPGPAHFGPGPDVTAERALIADCDVFALFYPLWLNSPPAILKGYLERVFGFGFAYGGKGHSGSPLLTGRKLISFSSSGAPSEWVETTGVMEAVQTLYDRYLAQLFGMKLLDHVHAGGVVPGASEYFIQARLSDAVQATRRHFAPAAAG